MKHGAEAWARAGSPRSSYLRALVAGDRSTAHAVAAPTFTVGNGDLCGVVDVKHFVVHAPPAKPTPDEVEYGTVLTTSGSDDGSIAHGKTTWFYALEQRDRRWMLTGGGSGPEPAGRSAGIGVRRYVWRPSLTTR